MLFRSVSHWQWLVWRFAADHRLAIVAQTGNMYNGLWYPIIIAGATFVIGTLFIKETKDVDIYAND